MEFSKEDSLKCKGFAILIMPLDLFMKAKRIQRIENVLDKKLVAFMEKRKD